MLNQWITDMAPHIENVLGHSKWGVALLIVLAGSIISRILKMIFKRILPRLTAKTKTSLDEDLLAVIDKPIRRAVFLLASSLAVMWLDPGAEAQYIILGIMDTMVFLILLVMAMQLTSLIFGVIGERLTKSGHTAADLIPLLTNLTRVILIGGTAMAMLASWKIDITPLLASAGIAGVAVALAAKDTLANFFGGISVFMDRPYKIGDYINLSSGERGEVVEIGVRSTRIQTRDDIQIIVPNASIASAKITNESAPEPSFRTRVKVGAAYGSDVDQVESLLLEAAADNQWVHDVPNPRVRFRSFGDSALNFELLCWLKDPRFRGRAVHKLNRDIYNSFNENGVVFPFPQMDVHIGKEES